MKSLILGVDVGGTNIKIGLINRKGKVIYRTNLATKSYIRSKTKLIDALVCCLRSILIKYSLTPKNILGVGIGLPGLIDTKKGLVHYLVNIPGWKKVPLRKIIEKKLGIPTFIDNDANVVTLGEWKFGAGRGIANLVCITLGTGVGGGLILNNVLYEGEGFSAGEIGHIPLNEKGPLCNCGGIGCLESYIGNKHLLKKARKIFHNKNITLENVTQMAYQGNRRALQFWQDVAAYLGHGLSGVVNLLNPHAIIIGGGIANTHKIFYQTVQTIIKKRAMRIPAVMVKIKKAQLGSDAGIIGGQVLVNHALSYKSK